MAVPIEIIVSPSPRHSLDFGLHLKKMYVFFQDIAVDLLKNRDIRDVEPTAVCPDDQIIFPGMNETTFWITFSKNMAMSGQPWVPVRFF